MKNPIKNIFGVAVLFGSVLSLQYCQRPDIAGAPSGKTNLSYGALSGGADLPWSQCATTVSTDTIVDLAIGADGSVFMVRKAKSSPGILGTVYQYLRNLNSVSLVYYGDSAASAVGIDTSGRPWAARRNTVMKWTGSGGPASWSATSANPSDTVRDIAVTENGTLYALIRIGSQSEGKICKWSGDIASASMSGSWDSVGNRAVAFAAGRGARLLKVDSTGRIDSLSGASTWNYVDSIPAREIAGGQDGRIWITLKNSPSGGDTVAYKDGGSDFVKISGLASHIASQGWVLFRADASGTLHRGSNNRSFETSFENINDVGSSNFSNIPAGKVSQESCLTDFKHGRMSHLGRISDATGPTNEEPLYSPHRAYPFLRIYQLPGGSLGRRTLTSMWVKLADFSLQDRAGVDDWFSFATFTSEADWKPVVTVNLDINSKVYLWHVPGYGQGPGQCPGGSCTTTFPQNAWVRLDMYMDMNPSAGQARVWQSGSLVQSADLTSQNDSLYFAHFGMYASPAVDTGLVWNDKLRIQEVSDIAEAELLVSLPF